MTVQNKNINSNWNVINSILRSYVFFKRIREVKKKSAFNLTKNV